METVKCIKSRRSIRKYSDRKIPDKIIRELIDCARRAPSSHNAQSWEFIIVKNKTTKEKLSLIHKWAGFAKNASAIIAVCYDSERVKFSPSNLINPALAAGNILLAAHSLGLGACYVYVKESDEPEVEQKAKKLLNVPENIGVLCMIPVGYPDEKIQPKKLRKIDEMAHSDKW